LNATASVQGRFVYSPAEGDVLTAGVQTLTATFTPTDAADYTTAQAAISFTVAKAKPIITWPKPASVAYGTTLSGAQLNATASVPGTFVYAPAAGTVLSAGMNAISATFTPTDVTDYTTAQSEVAVVVTKVTPAITWPTPDSIVYGTALGSAQLNAKAAVPGKFCLHSRRRRGAYGRDAYAFSNFHPSRLRELQRVTSCGVAYCRQSLAIRNMAGASFDFLRHRA
jgi:hypothetical protein